MKTILKTKKQIIHTWMMSPYVYLTASAVLLYGMRHIQWKDYTCVHIK